jgi:hypothetical protein
MLAFAHIPTGPPVNKGIDVNDFEKQSRRTATALTAIGADIEIDGATP